MNKKSNCKKQIFGFVIASALLAVAPASANDPKQNTDRLVSSNAQHGDADNTIRNSRDAGGETLTPFDQSNEQKDLDITAAIRKEINRHDDFSTNAKNIKIITTNDGRVALRGPVNSKVEATQIIEIAKKTAPKCEIISSLEVKTNG